MGIVAIPLIGHPDTSLPDAWNPAKPLNVAEPVTPVTRWKLYRAQASKSACIAALSGADLRRLEPLVEDGSAGCGIEQRLEISRVAMARLRPVETSCAVALRLALWETHEVQPAARAILGTEIAELLHFSSYSCRPIRTLSGAGARLSSHATAMAIDISGFRTDAGDSITLREDWDTNEPQTRFLRRVRDGACRWFATTLGPDFNALHDDHFHLQATGRGLCR